MGVMTRRVRHNIINQGTTIPSKTDNLARRHIVYSVLKGYKLYLLYVFRRTVISETLVTLAYCTPNGAVTYR